MNILNNCIQSLIDSINQDFEYEIIVVDNNSSDGVREFIRTSYPVIMLIENDRNLGYTKAMNIGMKKARGNYVVQLNPDIIVNPGAFQKLLAWMNEHPEVGISIPKVLNLDGTLQKQCRRGFARPVEVIAYFLKLDRLFPENKVLGNYVKTYIPEDEIAQVDAVSGSCMVSRKEVFADIEYLDERYFAYQEDTDFCFRANQAGWKVYYLPFASVVHLGGQGGSRTNPYRGIIEWHKSYYKYYRKNLARDYIFLVNWFMYVMIVLKLVFSLGGALCSKEKIVGTRKPS